MVRVTNPFLSMDASGTIGKALVAAKWKGRNYIRRHAIPANPRSGLQVGIRAAFTFLTQYWASATAGEKTAWGNRAAADNLTALNAMIAMDIDRMRRNLGPLADPTVEATTTVDAPTAGAATAQPKTLVCSWTEPAANKEDWAYALYMHTSAITPDISNLVRIVPKATTSVTVPNLTTGTTYYFKVRGISKNGTMGTLSSQFTGTPT